MDERNKKSIGKTIFIKTNMNKEAVKIIENIENIEIIDIKEKSVVIYIKDNSLDTFRILKQLHDNGIEVQDFHEKKESLEDIFMKVVGRKKHD
ncbi:DUF4162 domain-containing protein [Clostridium sp. BJN0013]|uniref:ATP-binding protein DrrA1-3 family domain-containing protein n=1 Tax=Clostridium sp. BJN0013 TaxID=3236840 RepID=UPI0034C69BB0